MIRKNQPNERRGQSPVFLCSRNATFCALVKAQLHHDGRDVGIYDDTTKIVAKMDQKIRPIIIYDNDSLGQFRALQSKIDSDRFILIDSDRINSDRINSDGPTQGMAKPIRIATLLERLYHLDRPLGANIWQCRGFYLDADRRFLRLGSGGRKKILTEKESALLVHLCRATKNDRPVGKEELLRDIWGYTKKVQSHTLETHLYRLRAKIDKAPFAITKSKDGYLFAASSGDFLPKETDSKRIEPD